MSRVGVSPAACYGPISTDAMVKTENTRPLILDADGTPLDNLIYMDNNGKELKALNVRNGYGTRCVLTSDIRVAIITRRKTKLVEDRCATLGITRSYQGQSDKLVTSNDLLGRLAVAPKNVAHVGDDLIG